MKSTRVDSVTRVLAIKIFEGDGMVSSWMATDNFLLLEKQSHGLLAETKRRLPPPFPPDQKSWDAALKLLLLFFFFFQNPILLRFVGLDRLFGSHYDEYVIEYSDFQTTLDPTVFDYAKSKLVEQLQH